MYKMLKRVKLNTPFYLYFIDVVIQFGYVKLFVSPEPCLGITDLVMNFHFYGIKLKAKS